MAAIKSSWQVERGVRGPIGGPQETDYTSILTATGCGSEIVIADIPRGAHAKANADHIVRCVNSHADLLAALERVTEQPVPILARMSPSLGQAIRDAITKAKETP